MAALDFPSSPSVGTIYPSPAVTGQPQYTYDGEKWTSGASTGAIYIADSPPAAPVGSLWYESDTGMLYVRYNDGSSTQWVAIPGGASDAVRYGVQTLTASEATQARKNIYAAPFDALAYSGIQINGGMDISQENGNTAINITNAGPYKYVVDGWKVAQGTASGVFTSGQFAGGELPNGDYCSNILMTAATTAITSVAAGDYVQITQTIEGYRVARLGWGTPNARPITVGFWIFATGTGHMALTVIASDNSRSYVADFTVNVSNTWEYKVITIPGDTGGTATTWKKDNSKGMELTWVPWAGSTYRTAAGGTWQAGVYLATTAQNNFYAATGVVNIANVIVLPGIEAPSAARSALIMRPYDQELVTCKRYYERYDTAVLGWFGTTQAGSNYSVLAPFQVQKRATPTLSFVASTGGGGPFGSGPPNSSSATLNSIYITVGATTSQFGFYQTGFIADARL